MRTTEVQTERGGSSSLKLCECGCGGIAPIATMSSKRAGHIRGQPVRFILGHRSKLNSQKPQYRVDEKTGCWEWLWGKDRNGYGVVHVWINGERTTKPAHLHIWEQKHGPMPDGKESRHRCNNRGCVNPNAGHVEAGTRDQNVQDRIASMNSQGKNYMGRPLRLARKQVSNGEES